MSEKKLKSRIVLKHDIEANWNKASTFIPLLGEIIIYDVDSNYEYERIKIGDGETSVVNLPFITSGDSDSSGADYGILTTGDGAAYSATVPGIDALESGASFIMVPHVTSTVTSSTLNVNGFGAKPIRRRLSSIGTGTQSGYTASWISKEVPFRVVYDGTSWIVEGLTKPAAADLYGTVQIAKGGTGATDAETALANLGAASVEDLDNLSILVGDESVSAQISNALNTLEGVVHIGANEPTNGATIWVDTDESQTQEVIDALNGYYTKDETNSIITSASVANSAKLGGKASQYYLHPRNLLVNSNFRNPVNQRGNTTYYATAMAIDRWELLEGTFSVADGYISTGFVQQKLPFENLTGVYTIAAKRTDGTLLVYSQEITSSYVYTEVTPSFGAWGNGLVRITLPAGEYVWAALYEGEYTAETLPPYVPKDYAEELAACQRYFVRFGGNVYTHIGLAHAQNETQLLCSVHLPQPMREGVLPTLVKGGECNMTAKAGTTFKNISAIGVNQVGVGALLLTLNSEGLTKGGIFDVYVPTGSWLDISADL